jgi:hypothetical protein
VACSRSLTSHASIASRPAGVARCKLRVVMQLLAGLRPALRRLRDTPLLTVVAVAALAVVVIVSTAIYSAVRSLFALPPSVPPPQELRALPAPLRTHLENERLDAVTSIGGLPLGVRDGLQRLFGSQTLDIADPGAEFQVTGEAANSSRPIRRLVAAGCSRDHCLVYYERGGSPHTWLVALFHWTPMATRFEWGASAPGNMATIDDARKAIISGAINQPNSLW